MNKLFIILSSLVMSACSTHNLSAEQREVLNHCGQKNYQCEQHCRASSIANTLTENVCLTHCIESYNQCKQALDETLLR